MNLDNYTIRPKEFLFLFVVSHLYVLMWIHFFETSYCEFVIFICTVYVLCQIFLFSYDIGWKISERIYDTEYCKNRRKKKE